MKTVEECSKNFKRLVVLDQVEVSQKVSSEKPPQKKKIFRKFVEQLFLSATLRRLLLIRTVCSNRQIKILSFLLTLFTPVSHFYTPWKRQKTFGFLTFSGGI